MNRTFQSKLAPYIEGLINERQTCGYSFLCYTSHLIRFDSSIVVNGLDSGELDETLFTAWAAQLETENQNSRNSRVYAVCELANYMESLGCTVFHPYKLGRRERTTPYIPTKDELRKLFTHIDRSRVKHKAFERFNIEYPILIRLYYHCGLRLNEVVGLRKKDVDLRRGTFHIRHSKGNKDRIVQIADDLLALVVTYDRKMEESNLHDREWFFPGLYADKPFSKHAIDKKFRELWMGAFPLWSGERPTIHSLRHAFVVHRMDDWVLEGNDLKTLMPYLSQYLGHSSIEETMYYYHQLDARSKAVRGILESCCPVVRGASL